MFLRLLLIVWAFILLSTVASAEYKRKVIYPNFFVPQSALPKAEKLPPIKTGTYAKSEDEASQETPLPQQKHDTTISTTVQKSYTTLDKFENLPEYKHKYDDYINDLKYIAQTGKYPQNAALQNDLQKMNSDEKFYIQ